MFSSISFYSFIKYSTVYINIFLKMPRGLIKLSKIAFSGIFVTIGFLIILLLPKQTIPAKKKKKPLTKQRKYKNSPIPNSNFYILCCSLLIIFYCYYLTRQPKDTNISYNCIKSSNFFSVNLSEILQITKYTFSGCQL